MMMGSCPFVKTTPTSSKGRAKAATVLRRSLIVETRLRYQVSPFETCSGQSGTVKGFLSQCFTFPCQYHSTNALHSIFSCQYQSTNTLHSISLCQYLSALYFPLSVSFHQYSALYFPLSV